MASRSTKRSPFFNHFKLQPAVVIPSMCLVSALLLCAFVAPKTLDRVLSHLKTDIFTHFSWVFILAVGILLFGAIFLCLSRFGDIRLGVDDAKPQYSSRSWFAMLFTTGMGIGIMFFGVAEPVMHFMAPPLGVAGTQAAAREAMHLTFFHWGYTPGRFMGSSDSSLRISVFAKAYLLRYVQPCHHSLATAFMARSVTQWILLLSSAQFLELPQA